MCPLNQIKDDPPRLPSVFQPTPMGLLYSPGPFAMIALLLCDFGQASWPLCFSLWKIGAKVTLLPSLPQDAVDICELVRGKVTRTLQRKLVSQTHHHTPTPPSLVFSVAAKRASWGFKRMPSPPLGRDF